MYLIHNIPATNLSSSSSSSEKKEKKKHCYYLYFILSNFSVLKFWYTRRLFHIAGRNMQGGIVFTFAEIGRILMCWLKYLHIPCLRKCGNKVLAWFSEMDYPYINIRQDTIFWIPCFKEILRGMTTNYFFGIISYTGWNSLKAMGKYTLHCRLLSWSFLLSDKTC